MNISYHPAAAQDIVNAAHYHETQLTGLGADFLAEVDDAIADIAEGPERFAEIDGVRMYLVKRFPYGIYFRCDESSVRILNVKHHRRNPRYGMNRR